MSADFKSSVLGTQQHWDDTYSRELQAFQDIGDVGEIWFGEEVQDRIIRWMTEKSQLSPTSRVLDIGCGNGMLLLALRNEGFTDLTGVDYSEGAVSLSRSIAQKEGVTDITFQACDILQSSSVEDLCRRGKFDVCLDKGTYDAISLHDTDKLCDLVTYRQNVGCLLSDGGLLVITSCNWTRQQLEESFNNDFEIVKEIAAPKYTFGGKTGQTVTTLVLKKKTGAGACDILQPSSVEDLCRRGKFDVCLDKGTYDAISLHDTDKLCDLVTYRQNVGCLLSDGGLLVITSCNWTRQQLEESFNNDFEIVKEIAAPKYTFGGKTGQTVTTLVLKKKTGAGV